MPKTSKKSSNNEDELQPKEIERPTEHDVLQGRGGQANNWIGNKTYRSRVDARKAEYVQSIRAQKTAMSRELVRNWRAQNPPGRFLEQDSEGLWREIGDKKARRKTSQLLREDAPIIRGRMGLPDPQRTSEHDSGTDSTGDSQDEWLPKGAATARQKSLRAAKANAKVELPKALGLGQTKPATNTQQTKAGYLQEAPKSSPTKKKGTKKHKGPSSIRKQDMYRAMKANDVPGAVASVASGPKTPKIPALRSPPPGHRPLGDRGSRPAIPPQGPLKIPPPGYWALQDHGMPTLASAEPETNARMEEPPERRASAMHPFRSQSQPPEACTNANQRGKDEPGLPQEGDPGGLQMDATADQRHFPRPAAFGNNQRELSWGSMGTYMRPLLEENMDTSDLLMGDLDACELGFGASGATLEPLNFDTPRYNNDRGWEGDVDMGEDYSERRCGEMLVACDCNVDFSGL